MKKSFLHTLTTCLLVGSSLFTHAFAQPLDRVVAVSTKMLCCKVSSTLWS